MFVRRFLPALLAASVLTAPAQAVEKQVDRQVEDPVAQATEEAKRTGRRVPVPAAHAETRDVYANPDGSFTADLYINPVRVRRGSGWAPIDTTLRPTGDGIEPVATTRRMVFSGGGKQPLVRLYDGTRWLELRWPGVLPGPEIAGDTATYAEVLPGVDLRMKATAHGFTKVFVVKSRAAAERLPELRFGLETSGLTENGATFRDGNGAAVFTAGAPMMWDSGTKRRPGRLHVTPGAISIVPDRELLTGEDTKFPVYIDPPFQPSRTGFAMVLSGYPGNAYWGGDGENLGKVGRCPQSLDSRCNNIGVARSFFRFDGSFLLGRHILQAEFNAFSIWSPSCQARRVEAWGTNPVDGGTNWHNQPWPGGGPTYLGYHEVAAGYNANCPGRSLGWGGWDNDFWNDATDPPIIRTVKNAQRFTGGIITILVKAENEGDELAWKKFIHNGDTPWFSVTYNSYPNVPVNRTVENKGCATEPNEPHVNPYVNNDPNQPQRGPRLSATVSDPDGGLVRARYEVQTRAGAWLWTGESAQSGSGSTFAVDVPAVHATDGAELRYRVLGSDGTDTSAWSSWCDVTIDRSAPDKEPAVSSATYPECAPPDYDPCPISGGIGRTAGFTFTANGVTDVAGFRYDLHDQPSTYVPANSTGVASVLVTPPDDKPQDLYVRSVDKAGNIGPMYRYHFRVGPGTSPKGHWRLDGLDETAVLDDSSNHHDGTTTMGPTLWRAGRHGDGLSLNGTASAFVNTGNGRTVDTTKTFSVSAWVRLDRLDAGWRTAVSQDGNQISGFFLQFNPNTRKWNFMMPASDANAAARRIAESAQTAVAGRWTHLVGSFDAATKQVRIHVDGVAGTPGSHPTPWDASGTVQLGRARYNSAGVDHWPGMLDEVRIYDRLLSVEEIGKLAGQPATEELFWPLDDESGSTTPDDASGNYRVGTTEGGATWTTGRVGTGAIRLDGTSGSLRTSAPVIRTDASFTVTAWVRLNQTGTAYQTVLSQDGNPVSGFLLRYRGDPGVWSFALYETADRFVSLDAADPAFAEWTHLAGVYDAAAKRIRLYVNSALVGEAAASSAYNAAGVFRVGRGMSTSSFLGGVVDDVHAWTGVRTQEQIRAEFLNPPTKRTSAYTGQLSRYWNGAYHHVVTTEMAPPGSHFEGSMGLMAPAGAADTVTIHSCRNGTIDFFLSLDANCAGYTKLGAIGQLYRNPPAGVETMAVYVCAMTASHFVSHDPNCEGQTVVGPLGHTVAYSKLIRSMSTANDDHITSIFKVAGHYRAEGAFGLVSIVYRPGTTALWLCGDGADTFSSIQSDCEGKTVVRWIGQVWTTPPADVTGVAELFRCRASWGDLFDSKDPECEGHTQDRSLGFIVTEL